MGRSRELYLEFLVCYLTVVETLFFMEILAVNARDFD